MSDMQEIMENEWSYLFNVGELGKKPEVLSLIPDEAERNRLCQRLGLLKINNLQADLKIAHENGSARVHVTGKISASLVQSCAVTLEPVDSKLSEEFEGWFADPDAAVSLVKARREKQSKGGQAEVKILDERDDPEPIINGKIDLGELVTQHLSLVIDPYPHAEGVHFEVGDDNEHLHKDESLNPFAALKDWKDKI